jgi:hypothetical protein
MNCHGQDWEENKTSANTGWKIRTIVALKGRGFSRADEQQQECWALAPEGSFLFRVGIPSAAKATSS